jgi:hypothetical protein
MYEIYETDGTLLLVCSTLQCQTLNDPSDGYFMMKIIKLKLDEIIVIMIIIYIIITITMWC